MEKGKKAHQTLDSVCSEKQQEPGGENAPDYLLKQVGEIWMVQFLSKHNLPCFRQFNLRIDE